jgi:hypothetical protein
VGHRSFYPTKSMTFADFQALIRGMPWVKGGKL